MIHNELKKLRKEKDLTLKELSFRVGYGTGNLSSYENGKLKAKDETLFRILTRGYKLDKQEANIQIAIWRKAEVEELYHLQLAQSSQTYNKGRNESQTLEAFLEKEGFDQKTIEKIKKEIEAYKKERS